MFEGTPTELHDGAVLEMYMGGELPPGDATDDDPHASRPAVVSQ